MVHAHCIQWLGNQTLCLGEDMRDGFKYCQSHQARFWPGVWRTIKVIDANPCVERVQKNLKKRSRLSCVSQRFIDVGCGKAWVFVFVVHETMVKLSRTVKP